MDETLMLPSTCAGLAIVALSASPATVALLRQLRSRAPKDNFYEDGDGKSTPESLAAFSNRKPKIAVVTLSTMALGISIAISVLASLQSACIENWLSTTSWALILLHATSLAAQHSPVTSHDLGLWLLASVVVTTALDGSRLAARLPPTLDFSDPSFVLRLASLPAALFLGLSAVLLPRRPHVFLGKDQVDAQATTTALSRATWAWARPLLRLAGKQNDLDDTDIPAADRHLRAQALKQDWDAFGFQGSLLRSLLRAYGGKLGFQWAITLLRCSVSIMPYWTMLRFINILEENDSRASSAWQLWSLVIWMSILNLLDAWLEGWLFWYSMSELSLPVRGQLSTLVFEKALRRKNVKAAEKTLDTQKDDKEAEGTKEKDDDGDGDESSVLQSRQAVVNLVGVDANRVSNFASMQFLLVNSVCKLVLFSVFLVKMIGWIPFAAGFFAWGLTLPCNFYFSGALMQQSGRLMKLRDEKLAVVNEALLGMRQIKFSALEARWEKRILAVRERELKTLWTYFLTDSVLFGCWVIGPIVLAATSLAAYALVHGQLLPSVAFVSIGIFKSLEVTLGYLPELISYGVDTLVSVRRLGVYLEGPEMEQTLSHGSEVAFDDASIAWPADDETADAERFILRNVKLTFPSGALSVISGKTGTGKSLLLSALLGEADLLEGSIRVPQTVPPEDREDDGAHPGNWILPGSVAYVAQTPWLESASLRDNILFGLPLIEERYNKVLDVCALTKDIDILPDGDMTELGANGVNLSGGQKWRVTLARAVYSRAEILILDDIFSAVDAHVGRHIFENCLTGELCKDRTRILVTHHVALVQSRAAYVVELGEGMVQHAGSIDSFLKNGTLDEIKRHEQELLQDDLTETETAVGSGESSTSETNQPRPTKDAKKFIEEEKREKGIVKWHVYLTYFKASGGWKLWIACLAIFLGYQIGQLGRSWWLRIWTAQADTRNGATLLHDKHGYVSALAIQQTSLSPDSAVQATRMQESLEYYLWMYIGISAVSAAVGALRFWWAYLLTIKASRVLFEKVLFTVLRTPLRWLDTVPLGRVLNRFTADFSIIDSQITIDWAMFMANFWESIAVCFAAFIGSYTVIPLAVLLLFAGGWIGGVYLMGARPLKRLESNAKSPVFEIFGASLAGVSTIRGYQKTQVFTTRMHEKLDKWGMVSFYMWLVNRWMSFRLVLVGAFFTSVIGAVIILTPSIDAALAGFILSFALVFAEDVLRTIRNYAGMELNMNSTERVVEYTELPTESLEGEMPPAAWPTSGSMEVDNLEVGYAPDLPAVLKGISFQVKDNERIGVVGRTGAGKSSLTLALFRFLEPRSGKVMIDGIDISKIQLQSLRSRLAIIPQDPVLFSGTVRTNLDPFDDNTDEELRESLARVHLADSGPPTPSNGTSSSAASTVVAGNSNIFRDLSSPIAESGGNLSQGQRQLLCLARAIVSRPKIMVLDEATSAVDMATDALIQRSIREEFTDSTLIVIAHRLSTIADFDRILVLSDGKAVEFGTPKELWEREGGVFRDMCESSGEKERLRQTILDEQESR